MNLSNIPQEMQALHQWVVYRGDKHPRKPNGDHASVNDPSTWCSFDEAAQAVKDKRALGPGFVFTEDDDYCGIDFDKCVEGGVLDPEVEQVVRRLNSYTERSLSGTGLHVIVKGKKPGGRCRKAQLEVYDHSRYFAMTGHLWQGHGIINGQQETLDSLYEETFGSVETEVAPVSVGELVLDPFREPPKDELAELLEDKDFKREWEHKSKSEDQSLSDYDWRLVKTAIEAGKDDQWLADLIIAHRKKWGDRDDLKKVTERDDYVSRTIAKARTETSSDALLNLLPFKVAEVIQIGEVNSEYELILDNGKKIGIGSTETLLSVRRAGNRLFELDYHLSKQARAKWREITIALRKMAEVRPTITRDETTIAWIKGYLRYFWNAVMPVSSEDELEKVFATIGVVAARGENGRVYVSVPDMTRYARAHLGWNKNVYSVAADLVSAGFTKMQLDFVKEGKRKRPSVWLSPPGFYDKVE